MKIAKSRVQLPVSMTDCVKRSLDERYPRAGKIGVNHEQQHRKRDARHGQMQRPFDRPSGFSRGTLAGRGVVIESTANCMSVLAKSKLA
ncbi:hypothetical protein [Rhizobium sp. R693]|uniref:hypothetical protein n=1 Tax=Rhizobium sp. R693 TaxID=1764276 RepID=UPI0011305D89|nr:hypothetical protein [Rhizobium sp. R693]